MEEQKLEILMQSKNLVETSYNVTAIQNRVYYYVCLPESDFLCTELKEFFIQWCYENSIFFDESTTVLFNEAKECFVDKKKVKIICKMSEYKYFLGIFRNKMEDDIREFAEMISL